MKKQGIDIKSLTAELKGLNRKEHNANTLKSDAEEDHESSLYADRLGKLAKHQKTKVDPTISSNTANLFRIIEKVNSKDHYSVDRFIYVDNDIHEVLVKLKTLTKLKISHLASSLLEEFVVEHKAAIQDIISRKQNKFLD